MMSETSCILLARTGGWAGRMAGGVSAELSRWVPPSPGNKDFIAWRV